MTKINTNVAGSKPVVARFIIADDVRKLIAQDPELAKVLITIGDKAVEEKQAGNTFTFDNVNKMPGLNLPAAATHYKRGKKAGKARLQKLIDAENANKAAALFRRVKQRYNQSNLLPTIQQLDSALGGSSTRQATVDLDAGQVETAAL